MSTGALSIKHLHNILACHLVNIETQKEMVWRAIELSKANSYYIKIAPRHILKEYLSEYINFLFHQKWKNVIKENLSS